MEDIWKRPREFIKGQMDGGKHDIKKGVGSEGRVKYGAVYGASKEEVMKKREEIAPESVPIVYPDKLNLLILGAGSHRRDAMEIADCSLVDCGAIVSRRGILDEFGIVKSGEIY